MRFFILRKVPGRKGLGKLLDYSLGLRIKDRYYELPQFRRIYFTGTGLTIKETK